MQDPRFIGPKLVLRGHFPPKTAAARPQVSRCPRLRHGPKLLARWGISRPAFASKKRNRAQVARRRPWRKPGGSARRVSPVTTGRASAATRRLARPGADTVGGVAAHGERWIENRARSQADGDWALVDYDLFRRVGTVFSQLQRAAVLRVSSWGAHDGDGHSLPLRRAGLRRRPVDIGRFYVVRRLHCCMERRRTVTDRPDRGSPTPGISGCSCEWRHSLYGTVFELVFRRASSSRRPVRRVRLGPVLGRRPAMAMDEAGPLSRCLTPKLDPLLGLHFGNVLGDALCAKRGLA